MLQIFQSTPNFFPRSTVLSFCLHFSYEKVIQRSFILVMTQLSETAFQNADLLEDHSFPASFEIVCHPLTFLTSKASISCSPVAMLGTWIVVLKAFNISISCRTSLRLVVPMMSSLRPCPHNRVSITKGETKEERNQPWKASANNKWKTENDHLKTPLKIKLIALHLSVSESCQHPSYKTRIRFQKSGVIAPMESKN